MTAVYVLTVVLLSPADEGLDCVVCNVRTHVAMKLVCHIRTQQTRSTEKDEDINWVRTNLRTAKNHSAESGDMLCGSCTVILWLAAWKLNGIRMESMQIFHGICQIL